jgi:hypothetical protein
MRWYISLVISADKRAINFDLIHLWLCCDKEAKPLLQLSPVPVGIKKCCCNAGV